MQRCRQQSFVSTGPRTLARSHVIFLFVKGELMKVFALPSLTTFRERTKWCIPGAIIGVLLFSVMLFGQSGGRISGIVTDQTGAILPGSTVSIIDTERGTTRTLTTDAAGEYNAPSLIPGNYTVRVEAKGFKRLDRPGIAVGLGQELRVDLTPQPGDQTQTVTVTESIPLVDPTSATLGGAVSNAEVNDLPLNGRNYQNLLGLRPGVMLQPGGSPWTQSTNNVRPDETVWLVDGIINFNPYDGRSIANSGSPVTDMAAILPIDAIQEFNVMESPKAEYGWKPGAQVNVGIRSGTNTLHGAAYAFGRTDSWDARNAFNQGLNPQGVCGPNPGVPAQCDKLPTSLEQFGGVLGGHIIKDKLFFFGGYEGLLSTVGNAFVIGLPATASLGGDPKNSMADAIAALNARGIPLSPVSLKTLGCTAGGACTGGYLPNTGTSNNYVSSFPNVNTSKNYLGKVDYNINDKNRINGFVLNGEYSATGEDHAATNALFEDAFVQTTWTVGTSWVYTPNSHTVNEARLGYDRFVFLIDPIDRGTISNGTNYPINTGSAGFPSVNISGFDAQAHQLLGSQNGRPSDNTPNPYYDIQDAVSDQIGRHSLRFGVEFAHFEGDSDGHDQRGVIKFAGNQAFAGSTSLEDFFAGLPASATHLAGIPDLRMIWKSTAAFFQDDWRITPRLMINMGLRYAYVTPMKEANNQIANFLPSAGGFVQQGSPGTSSLYKADGKDPSPRFGVAYDLDGKGTTVLRGGISLMYSSFNASTFVGNPGFQGAPGGLSLGSQPDRRLHGERGAGNPLSEDLWRHDHGRYGYHPGLRAELEWRGLSGLRADHCLHRHNPLQRGVDRSESEESLRRELELWYPTRLRQGFLAGRGLRWKCRQAAAGETGRKSDQPRDGRPSLGHPVPVCEIRPGDGERRPFQLQQLAGRADQTRFPRN